MTLVMDLTQEEAQMVAEAEAQGIDIKALLKEAIRPLLNAPVQKERPFFETATPEEWVKEFQDWADSHGRNTPVLSDEAISRESIYGERG